MWVIEHVDPSRILTGPPGTDYVRLLGLTVPDGFQSQHNTPAEDWASVERRWPNVQPASRENIFATCRLLLASHLLYAICNPF